MFRGDGSVCVMYGFRLYVNPTAISLTGIRGVSVLEHRLSRRTLLLCGHYSQEPSRLLPKYFCPVQTTAYLFLSGLYLPDWG